MLLNLNYCSWILNKKGIQDDFYFYFMELRFEINQCCSYQKIEHYMSNCVPFLCMHALDREIPFTHSFQVSK